MKEFKTGVRVVVTASDEELRQFNCNGIIKNGGSHKITGISNAGDSVELDNIIYGWVLLDMIELSEAGSK